MYSDVSAPFRMGFKIPAAITTPLTYTNNLTTFMILDDFDAITPFSGIQVFECLIK